MQNHRSAIRAGFLFVYRHAQPIRNALITLNGCWRGEQETEGCLDGQAAASAFRGFFVPF